MLTSVSVRRIECDVLKFERISITAHLNLNISVSYLYLRKKSIICSF